MRLAILGRNTRAHGVGATATPQHPSQAVPASTFPRALQFSPMLATLGSMPSRPDDFAYEIKWDGYRGLARCDGSRCGLASRNGIDLTPRFPELMGLHSALAQSLVLDGEIVAIDDHVNPIAKQRTSLCHPGRRAQDWIKRTRSDEFVVVGYFSSGRHGLSSLLFGYYGSPQEAREPAPVRYCGKVGSGFSERDRHDLFLALRKMRRSRPPCTGVLPADRGVVWCDPDLVAQITFTEWTRDGALRHPAFSGLVRQDKPDRSCWMKGSDHVKCL
jgi:ATP-dependent DNA ligase